MEMAKKGLVCAEGSVNHSDEHDPCVRLEMRLHQGMGMVFFGRWGVL